MLSEKYWSIYVSDEIYLEKLKEEDAIIIKDLYSDKDNVKYMDNVIVNWHGDINRAKETVHKINSSSNDFVWVIKYRDQKVGLIGLENMDLSKHYAEVWYVLARNYHRKGIMTKSVIGLLEYLSNTSDFNKLSATAKLENNNSIKLLEKVGFRHIGKEGERLRFERELTV